MPAPLHMPHYTTVHEWRSPLPQSIWWEPPDSSPWGPVQGVIVLQDPWAMEPLGTANWSHHQWALPHGTRGRLQINRPNFQRVLWQLVPVFWHGPRPTQAARDTLPPYWGEILTPLALSYLQAKQSEATKQSPPWAVMPNIAVESPKTKCSSSKGRHHCSFRHGCNTSTPKCPDSTSAKKPSSSKDPVLKEQDKSPWSHGSCKCGHSPSPSAKSDGCKQKEATQKTPANSTPPSPSAPVGLMAFTVPQDPTTKLHPPSITSTPWVLVPLDSGDLHLKKVGAH